MIDDLMMKYPRVQEDEVSMIGGWHSFEQPLMQKDCEHIAQARANYRKRSEYEERLALVKATFLKKKRLDWQNTS